MYELAMEFQLLKIWLHNETGLARDALHVHIGLAAFILVRLLWRGRGGWLAAWLVALAGTLLGEWLDLRSANLTAPLRPGADHWHDIWNTMLWPSLLLLVGRWLEPRSRQQAEPTPPAAADGSGEDVAQSFEQA